MGKEFLTTDNLTKILDRLVSRPSWKAVMGTIGASEGLAFQWRAKSIKAAQDNDRSTPFFLEWRGTWDFWHAHAGRARLENIITYEASIRDECLNGREVAVLGPDQKPIYKEAECYIGRDDEWIRLSEGLDMDADVKWYRLEHDANGRPIPLTKTEFPPAPVRLRVLEQDRRYIHKEQHDVAHSGEITVKPALQRLPGEARPDVAKLKALAAMSPEERRKALGASAVPLDAAGRRTLPASAPKMDDAPDDRGDGLRPPQPTPQQPTQPTQPSYARPSQRLDQSGRGEGVPPQGGFKVG
jgi:hypothetical protein